jgi:hypothetical protein
LAGVFAFLLSAPQALAWSDHPSAKWVNDTTYDAVQTFNLADSIWLGFQTDPSLANAANVLKDLGSSLRFGFYPQVDETASKTVLRAYVDGNLKQKAQAALDGLQFSVVPLHPELAGQAAELEGWLNFLFKCVHSDTGNGHDAP